VTGRVRCFLAVDVPSPTIEGLPGRSADTPAHFTLAFLGEVTRDALDRLTPALAVAVGRHRPFPLTLGGLGTFPRPDRPRILWVGVTEGRDELQALAASVHAVVRSVGLSLEDRPFVPHLTVRRLHLPRDGALARELLTTEAGRTYGRTIVEEVRLKSSDLRPGGAVHHVEARFPLAARGPESPPGAP
jgi:2'-5' RNA ligase